MPHGGRQAAFAKNCLESIDGLGPPGQSVVASRRVERDQVDVSRDAAEEFGQVDRACSGRIVRARDDGPLEEDLAIEPHCVVAAGFQQRIDRPGAGGGQQGARACSWVAACSDTASEKGRPSLASRIMPGTTPTVLIVIRFAAIASPLESLTISSRSTAS